MASRSQSPIYVGCAGWNLPKAIAAKFAATGSHLQRYASRFNAVEINSSFYRPHRQSTYARWADTVPDAFRFAVKVPKAMTHTARLEPADGEIAKFAAEVSGLGARLGCLLVQLPPSLTFDAKVAQAFFEALNAAKPGENAAVVCEPRHATWFTPEADQLLEQFNVSRVLADPPVGSDALTPDARSPITYFRLHGSPRMYYSSYAPAFIRQCAQKLLEAHQAHRASWCIFDNTAEGAATENALQLLEELERLQTTSATGIRQERRAGH